MMDISTFDTELFYTYSWTIVEANIQQNFIFKFVQYIFGHLLKSNEQFSKNDANFLGLLGIFVKDFAFIEMCLTLYKFIIIE